MEDIAQRHSPARAYKFRFRQFMKAPRLHSSYAWLLASLLVPITVCAAVPDKIPFQGRVLAAGIPFQGTGQFKFALVNADGSQTYWRNSVDVAPADGVPDTAVSLPVVKGLYSVLLGDTSVPNMAGNLTPSTVSSGDARLRVWFNDGVRGFQLLAPDQPLASVPYALTAASLVDNPVFNGNVGIGIDEPTAPLDVAGRINAASISLGGYSALDMPGSANVFVGNAGSPLTASINSTGLGWGALELLSEGNNNTAVGAYALPAATRGSENTAVGVASLYATTKGIGNTAIGHEALHDNTTGGGNIAVGWNAGRKLTTGSDNIAIGNPGVAGESSTIRIGTPEVHQTTHLAGTVKAARFEGDGSGLTQVPGTMQTTSTVVAWGNNSYGQTTVSPESSGVSAIAAGFGHTVALKQDGTVVAWGRNNAGQTTVPPGLSGVSAIAAGLGHTVALKRDGTVVAWGDNRQDQTTLPPGLGLSGVSAIAAGDFHTVAIRPSPQIPSNLFVSGTVSAQAFFTTSDREAKQQITPVDPEAVLAKVAQLPLSEWSFKSAPTTRHLGPMAQDFRAAFGLGPDDRHIATVDADGVALAAIQGLHREVRGLHREVGGLRDALKSKNQEIEELRHLLSEVRALLDRGEGGVPKTEHTLEP